MYGASKVIKDSDELEQNETIEIAKNTIFPKNESESYFMIGNMLWLILNQDISDVEMEISEEEYLVFPLFEIFI